MSDTTPTVTEPEVKAPEFEGEFDAERAKTAITNLRTEVASYKERLEAVTGERDAFKEAATKTGAERDDALNKAVKRAEDAERALALSKHNLDEDTLAEWADYLTGTPEEVDAKAAKIAALVKAKGAEPEAPAPEPGTETKTPEAPAPEPVVPVRPKAALVPGTGAEAAKPFDAKAIAERARG